MTVQCLKFGVCLCVCVYTYTHAHYLSNRKVEGKKDMCVRAHTHTHTHAHALLACVETLNQLFL